MTFLTDYELVRPSVEDVAILERTRTTSDNVGLGGDESTLGTFTATTRPTNTEVEELIDTALDIIVPQLGDAVASRHYGAIKRTVAVQTAQLIESSFFRETAMDWTDLLTTLLTPLLAATASDTAATPGVAKKGRITTVINATEVSTSLLGTMYATLPTSLPD